MALAQKDSTSGKTLWTIGHSTRSLAEFTALLKHYQIECIADVRHFPGSRKFPHFNKDALQLSLPENGILYEHFESLGGRRKADADSVNTIWKHPSFRGYADYMASAEFAGGLSELHLLAAKCRTAIMCSEAVWWRCHRSMIADKLKSEDWRVLHIIATNALQEHPYTSPAKIIDGELVYR